MIHDEPASQTVPAVRISTTRSAHREAGAAVSRNTEDQQDEEQGRGWSVVCCCIFRFMHVRFFQLLTQSAKVREFRRGGIRKSTCAFHRRTKLCQILTILL
mmetsp:Transcript_23599/g.47326  ORF Transcript_23599/g.47326 Transcript_23599/m.47326 type:complete len:101 (-) Transcript_23599:122-424(-)